MPGRWTCMAAAVVMLASCTEEPAVEPPRTIVGTACALPHRELVRIAQGYHPKRSGEVQIVPQRPHYIGLSRSHSGPWDYLQEIPILFYGPGHVPAAGAVRAPASIADLAPTLGAHLGFELHTLDGRVLEEAVVPGADPPKLVVIVVWDGGGLNTLDRHPDAWPYVRGLIDQGAWYEATLGSSPSVTPATHASIGTGMFPAHHGLVDLRMRLHGGIVSATDVGPVHLRKPTLADLFDRALGNAPLMATMGWTSWHLVMSGRGAMLPGGDRDIAALTGDKGDYVGWSLPDDIAHAFSAAPYLASFPGLPRETQVLDAGDGSRDGLWGAEVDLEVPRNVFSSPAYSRYQAAALETLILREGFGDDDVPDLLLTNFKQVDLVGHHWGMESWQMGAVLRSSDAALRELVTFLDREIGEGEWVLALTADHGTTPPPRETGAFLIDRNELRRDVEGHFDRDADSVNVVQAPRPTQLWIDEDELRDNGLTLEDVARYVLGYTKGNNRADPSRIPSDRRDDLLFAAAFPSSLLEGGLPCLSPS